MAKEITLDANGFASEPGDITVYNYDGETGVSIGSTVETLMVGVGIPAHSTITKPPAVNSGEVAVWNVEAGAWEAKEDHRGEVVYSTDDGREIIVSQVGPYPENTTILKPETAYDKWDGNAWVTNTVQQHADQVAAAENEKRQRISEANANTQAWQVQLILGIITDSDKEALTLWMKYAQAVQAVDTSTAPDINWPAKPE